MNLDIIISADDVKKEKVYDKSVAVVDILRATSVIVTAIYNGCKAVIPVLTVAEAFKKVDGKGGYILGGERNAVKIDKFDLSNSPLEYIRSIIEDKILVMTTTNGTRAIKRCSEARTIVIAAMINAEAVAKRLIELKNNIVIVNSGTNGQFSMDDFICSGYIVENILKNTDGEVELTDIAKTARYIYEKNKDIISFIRRSDHYKVIKKLKFEEDLSYCCNKDIIDIVPEYRDGIIK
ncbi:2-phosphosulfolactate phosphatase family protein [Clostridium sp. LBM24168]